MFLVGVMLLGGAQSVTAAQPLESGRSGKKLNLSKVERVETPGVRKPRREGLRVRFAQEDMVHEITPRQKKEKRERFDVPRSAVSAELRDDAKSVLAVLVTAKASGDIKLRRAVLDISEEVLAKANAAAAALNCKNPIKRCNAFRQKK